MGLFDTKYSYQVSSVTYPLGSDDEADRTDYLQYTVLNAILQSRPITESITKSYIRGRGMDLRRTYNYAREHYHYGLPASNYVYHSSPDHELIRPTLEALHPNKTVFIAQTSIGLGEYRWWAERHLTTKYGYDRVTKQFAFPPVGIQANATVSFDISLGGAITILMVNSDGNSKSISFKPADLIPRQHYLHLIYQTMQTFPIEETSSTRPRVGGDEPGVITDMSYVIRGGEIQETEVATITELTSSEVITRVRTEVRIMSRAQYMFYKLGSGVHPAFDALFTSGSTTVVNSPWYPSYPIRLDNKSLEQHFPPGEWEDHPLYKTGKKMFDKCGIDIDEITDKVLTNPQIAEIDFAYLTFGVELNTKQPESLKYLFEFFDMCRAQSTFNEADFAEWSAKVPLLAQDEPPVLEDD